MRAESVAYAAVFAGCVAVSLLRASVVGDRRLCSGWSFAALGICAACGYLSLSAAPGLAGAVGIAAVAVAAWTDAVAERIYHVLSILAAAVAIAARVAIDGGVLSSLATGLALAVFFAAWRWLRGTGGGDIGIAFVCGVAFGPIVAQEVLLVGALAAVMLLAVRMRIDRAARRSFVPLAPFLLAGVALLATVPMAWRIS